jgi:WD40 repeat protein
MLRYDRVLIAPSRAELDRALGDAAGAANKGCRARKLEWAPARTVELLSAAAGAPEGLRQWNGEGESKQRGFSTETRSALAVAWWTDPVKRVHYRVGADRVFTASSHVENLFCPYRERPPLWVVHRENLYFRGQREALSPYAICRCGAAGPPASIGWMGQCCAACHDRVEEGSALPLPDGEPARTMLLGHTSWAGPLAYAPDGRSLISAERSGMRLLVHDLATGAARELPRPGQLHALALSPDGSTLAAGYWGGEVDLLSPADGAVRYCFVRHTFTAGDGADRVLALAFSPDGSLLAVAPHGEAELWDLTGPAPVRRAVVAERLTGGRNGRYLAFSPDGRTLAVGHGARRAVLLWDVESGRGRRLEVEGLEYDNLVAYSPDGRALGVIHSPPGSVHLVEADSGRVLTRPDFDRANDLAFSPDGRVLAVAGHDDSLRLYSVPDGRPLGVFFWHMSGLNAVAFSPDGRWLASSSDDHVVKLWPVALLLAAGGDRAVPTTAPRSRHQSSSSSSSK